MGYYEGVVVKHQAYSERVRVFGSKSDAIRVTRNLAEKGDVYSVFTKDDNLTYSATKR